MHVIRNASSSVLRLARADEKTSCGNVQAKERQLALLLPFDFDAFVNSDAFFFLTIRLSFSFHFPTTV